MASALGAGAAAGAPGAGTGAAGAGAAAGGAQAGAAALSATAQAGAVATILTAVVGFLKRRKRRQAERLADRLFANYPQHDPSDLRRVVREELDREAEFERRMQERLDRDVRDAMKVEDAEKRRQIVQRIMDREKRYMKMRERAMAERADARAEYLEVEKASPLGAFWALDPSVQNHTLDCIAMANRFWPWEVLRRIHPPMHPGCPCRLLSLDEAIRLGLMTREMVPDTKDAIRRAKAAFEGARALMEAAYPEEIAAYLSEITGAEWDWNTNGPNGTRTVQEATLRGAAREVFYGLKPGERYAPGTAKAGQFKPRRGGDPGKRIRKSVRGALQKVVPRAPRTPTETEAARDGRWVWVKGRFTFVPEHRNFDRTLDGVRFTSPPGSTNVYRDGELASVDREEPLHPDLKKPAPHERRIGSTPKLDLGSEKLTPAVAEKIEAEARRIRGEWADQARERFEEGMEALDPSLPPVALGASLFDVQPQLVGFREIPDTAPPPDVGQMAARFYHPESGSTMRLVWDTQRTKITDVAWEPGSGEPVKLPDRLDRPAANAEEFGRNVQVIAAELGEHYGEQVRLTEVYVDPSKADHSGSHSFGSGAIRLGSDVPESLEAAARAREAGRPLTESEASAVYASYKVGMHEAAHAVNPIHPYLYGGEPGAKGLEEALTEEMAHVLVADTLRREGQDDVLEWAARHPDESRRIGSYGYYRQRLDHLFNLAGIAPEERRGVVEAMKMRMDPEDRPYALADLLVQTGVAANQAEGVEIVVGTMDSAPAQNLHIVPILSGDLPDVEGTVNDLRRIVPNDVIDFEAKSIDGVSTKRGVVVEGREVEGGGYVWDVYSAGKKHTVLASEVNGVVEGAPNDTMLIGERPLRVNGERVALGARVRVRDQYGADPPRYQEGTVVRIPSNVQAGGHVEIEFDMAEEGGERRDYEGTEAIPAAWFGDSAEVIDRGPDPVVVRVGETVRYDGRADGGYSEAVVKNVRHDPVADEWVIEGRTTSKSLAPGERVVLTRDRVGGKISVVREEAEAPSSGEARDLAAAVERAYDETPASPDVFPEQEKVPDEPEDTHLPRLYTVTTSERRDGREQPVITRREFRDGDEARAFVASQERLGVEGTSYEIDVPEMRSARSRHDEVGRLEDEIAGVTGDEKADLGASRADADEWMASAPKGAWTGVQFHGTGAEGEASIRSEGVDFDRSGVHRAFFTTDKESEAPGWGLGDRAIPLAVRFDNPLILRGAPLDSSSGEKFAQAREDGYDGVVQKVHGETWAIALGPDTVRIIEDYVRPPRPLDIRQHEGSGSISAIALDPDPYESRVLARIELDTSVKPPVIRDVQVVQSARRERVAMRLLNEVRRQNPDMRIAHAESRSDEGEAWIQAMPEEWRKVIPSWNETNGDEKADLAPTREEDLIQQVTDRRQANYHRNMALTMEQIVPGDDPETVEKREAALAKLGVSRPDREREVREELEGMQGRMDQVSPETRGKLERAIVANHESPLWRSIEDRFGRDLVLALGGKHVADPRIPQRADNSDKVAAHRHFGYTAVYAKTIRSTGDREVEHVPSGTAYTMGLQAILRHEYAHELWRSEEMERHRAEFGREVGKLWDDYKLSGLSVYSHRAYEANLATNERMGNDRNDPLVREAAAEETFTELIAVITSPTYDPQKELPWVRDMGEKVLGWLGVERPGDEKGDPGDPQIGRANLQKLTGLPVSPKQRLDVKNLGDTPGYRVESAEMVPGTSDLLVHGSDGSGTKMTMRIDPQGVAGVESVSYRDPSIQGDVPARVLEYRQEVQGSRGAADLVREWGPDQERAAIGWAAEADAVRTDQVADALKRIEDPPPPGHVRLYHGTTAEGASRAREVGITARRPEEVSAMIEDHFGLPRGQVHEATEFGFSRYRSEDASVYVTGDVRKAASYAREGNEMTADALRAAHRIIHSAEYADAERSRDPDAVARVRHGAVEFSRRYRQQMDVRPAVLALDVPLEAFADNRPISDSIANPKADEINSIQDWFDFHERRGIKVNALALGRTIPPEWVHDEAGDEEKLDPGVTMLGSLRPDEQVVMRRLDRNEPLGSGAPVERLIRDGYVTRSGQGAALTRTGREVMRQGRGDRRERTRVEDVLERFARRDRAALNMPIRKARGGAIYQDALRERLRREHGDTIPAYMQVGEEDLDRLHRGEGLGGLEARMTLDRSGDGILVRSTLPVEAVLMGDGERLAVDSRHIDPEALEVVPSFGLRPLRSDEKADPGVTPWSIYRVAPTYYTRDGEERLGYGVLKDGEIIDVYEDKGLADAYVDGAHRRQREAGEKADPGDSYLSVIEPGLTDVQLVRRAEYDPKEPDREEHPGVSLQGNDAPTEIDYDEETGTSKVREVGERPWSTEDSAEIARMMLAAIADYRDVLDEPAFQRVLRWSRDKGIADRAAAGLHRDKPMKIDVMRLSDTGERNDGSGVTDAGANAAQVRVRRPATALYRSEDPGSIAYAVDPRYTALHEAHHMMGSTTEFDDGSLAAYVWHARRRGFDDEPGVRAAKEELGASASVRGGRSRFTQALVGLFGEDEVDSWNPRMDVFGRRQREAEAQASELERQSTAAGFAEALAEHRGEDLEAAREALEIKYRDVTDELQPESSYRQTVGPRGRVLMRPNGEWVGVEVDEDGRLLDAYDGDARRFGEKEDLGDRYFPPVPVRASRAREDDKPPPQFKITAGDFDSLLAGAAPSDRKKITRHISYSPKVKPPVNARDLNRHGQVWIGPSFYERDRDGRLNALLDALTPQIQERLSDRHAIDWRNSWLGEGDPDSARLKEMLEGGLPIPSWDERDLHERTPEPPVTPEEKGREMFERSARHAEMEKVFMGKQMGFAETILTTSGFESATYDPNRGRWIYVSHDQGETLLLDVKHGEITGVQAIRSTYDPDGPIPNEGTPEHDAWLAVGESEAEAIRRLEQRGYFRQEREGKAWRFTHPDKGVSVALSSARRGGKITSARPVYADEQHIDEALAQRDASRPAAGAEVGMDFEEWWGRVNLSESWKIESTREGATTISHPDLGRVRVQVADGKITKVGIPDPSDPRGVLSEGEAREVEVARAGASDLAVLHAREIEGMNASAIREHMKAQGYLEVPGAAEVMVFKDHENKRTVTVALGDEYPSGLGGTTRNAQVTFGQTFEWSAAPPERGSAAWIARELEGKRTVPGLSDVMGQADGWRADPDEFEGDYRRWINVETGESVVAKIEGDRLLDAYPDSTPPRALTGALATAIRRDPDKMLRVGQGGEGLIAAVQMVGRNQGKAPLVQDYMDGKIVTMKHGEKDGHPVLYRFITDREGTITEVGRAPFVPSEDLNYGKLAEREDRMDIVTPQEWTDAWLKHSIGEARAKEERERGITETLEKMRAAIEAGKDPVKMHAKGLTFEETQDLLKRLDFTLRTNPRTSNRGGARTTTMTFENKMGDRITVKKEGGKYVRSMLTWGQSGGADMVLSTTWKPNKRLVRERVGRTPQTVDELVSDMLGRSDELAQRYGAENVIGAVNVRGSFERSLAYYDPNTSVIHIGKRVKQDLARIAKKRKDEEPLTDADLGDLYHIYQVMQHEMNHGVNPQERGGYRGHGVGFEEALTEETSQVMALEWLEENGETEVLDWVRRNRDHHHVKGTYQAHRQRLRKLLEQTNLEPEEWREHIFEMKFKQSQSERDDYIVDLVTEGTSDGPTSRRQVLGTFLSSNKIGARGVSEFASVIDRTPDFDKIDVLERPQTLHSPDVGEVSQGDAVLIEVDGRTEEANVVAINFDGETAQVAYQDPVTRKFVQARMRGEELHSAAPLAANGQRLIQGQEAFDTELGFVGNLEMVLHERGGDPAKLVLKDPDGNYHTRSPEHVYARSEPTSLHISGDVEDVYPGDTMEGLGVGFTFGTTEGGSTTYPDDPLTGKTVKFAFARRLDGRDYPYSPSGSFIVEGYVFDPETGWVRAYFDNRYVVWPEGGRDAAVGNLVLEAALA